jgi:hypothetical protein
MVTRGDHGREAVPNTGASAVPFTALISHTAGGVTTADFVKLFSHDRAKATAYLSAMPAI